MTRLLPFIAGSWPIACCPLDEFQLGTCQLVILKSCRHHIMDLRCSLPEESLCSLPTHLMLSFPGQFVQIQYVVALASDKQELFDCRLEASGNRRFKIVSTVLYMYTACAVHVCDLSQVSALLSA